MCRFAGLCEQLPACVHVLRVHYLLSNAHLGERALMHGMWHLPLPRVRRTQSCLEEHHAHARASMLASAAACSWPARPWCSCCTKMARVCGYLRRLRLVRARRTQSFSENITRVPGGDCWGIGGGAWRAGQELVLVLHDDDWFAAALDLDAVQQLSIVDAAVDKLQIAPHLYAPPPAASPAAAALAPGAGSGYGVGFRAGLPPGDGGQAVPAAPAPFARLPARSV